MKPYKILAAFVLVLQVCMSPCGALTCNYKYYTSCKDIVNAFEHALVEDDANIFALDESFHPSNRYPSPSLAIVYVVYLPAQNAYTAKVRGWCKSSTYSIIPPLMFETLSTGLTYLYHIRVSRQILGSTILSLNITEFTNPLSHQHIDYAIEYITPWLKLYSKKDQKSGTISYIEDEKGYTCDTYGYTWYLTLISILIIIAAFFVLVGVIRWLLCNENDQSAELDQKEIFFFVFGFFIFFINLSDIGYLIYEAHIYFSQEIPDDNNTILSQDEIDKLVISADHKGTKIVQIIASLFALIIGGIVGVVYPNKRCPENDGTNKWKVRLCYIGYYVTFGSYFCFTLLLGLNILPTFLILFAAPIETISILVLSLTLANSIVMAIVLIVHHVKTNGCKKCPEIKVFLLLVLTTTLFITSLLMIIFLEMLANATNDNVSHLAQFCISSGSTLFAGLISYGAKKIVSPEKEEYRELS